MWQSEGSGIIKSCVAFYTAFPFVGKSFEDMHVHEEYFSSSFSTSSVIFIFLHNDGPSVEILAYT